MQNFKNNDAELVNDMIETALISKLGEFATEPLMEIIRSTPNPHRASYLLLYPDRLPLIDMADNADFDNKSEIEYVSSCRIENVVRYQYVRTDTDSARVRYGEMSIEQWNSLDKK